jgi:hypothetical protein
MAKKLKKEELADLQKAVNKVNHTQLQIGGLELQKHQLLHEMGAAEAELQSLQATLKEVYGDVTINFHTGAISKDEPSKED